MKFFKPFIIRGGINHSRGGHSRPVSRYGVNSSGNPENHWILGQARNDRLRQTYVVMLYILAYKIFANFPFELKKIVVNSMNAAHNISRNTCPVLFPASDEL
jgi:hypothetical protein